MLHVIGRGAFGSVYKAHDTELDRFVAVKVPRAGKLDSKEDEERFLREARSAARLNHPAIVKVHEVGFEQGVPFIVSDFVPSRTLAEVIAASRPSFRESAALVARIAEALDHAHREKVVHRDIKPANILIDAAGDPHVSDFGLARRDEEEVTVTLEGQILGTPAYMSPEQAAGDHVRVGPASDQYSLGVLFYELLTGERPFRGSRSMILQQVLNDEPRAPRSLNDRVPRDLETICLKTLAKEPGRRYASCGALARDLRAWLGGEAIAARPVSRPERALRWARRNPAIATLGGAVFATAIISTVLAYRMSVARNDATEQLVQLHAESGARRMDDADLLGSLRSFAEALRLKPDDAGRSRAHRMRSASILDRCPRLLNVWFHPGPIYHVELDRRGELAVTMARHEVRVFDLARAGELASLKVDGVLRGIAVSPDGGTVGVVVWGEEALIWPWREAAEKRVVLEGLADAARLVFHPDGSSVLVCGPKETRVFDAVTGKPVGPPFVGAGYSAFSPDGSRVATACGDWTARVWDARTAEPLTPPLKHWGLIHHLAFSHDGRFLATASDDATAQVWDAATGQPRGDPMKHDSSVRHIAFSPDDARIATACGSNYACIWNAETGARASPPLRHQTSVYQLAFRFDGRSLLTASSDGTARLWDTVTGAEASQPLRHGGDVCAAWFLPDGHRVATASEDGCLKLWDTARGEPRFLPHLSNNPVPDVAFSPNGKTLAIASHDSTACLFDVETGVPVCPWLRHSLGLNRVVFSPDGRLVATCSWDGTAQVWDASTGLRRTPPLVNSLSINDIAFTPDGAILATASDSGSVRLWSTSTGEQLGAKLPHPARATSLAFSPNGELLLVAIDGPVASVWNRASGTKLHSLSHSGYAKRAAFSPDGRRILTASTDGRAMVWDASSGAALAATLPHSNDVLHAGFSPDGTKLVTASSDGTARIWSAATGAPLTRELRHRGAVLHAAFSPDSGLLATACGDGSARVWDVSTGDPVTPQLTHGDKVLCVAFSPDGSSLATGAADNCSRLWSLRCEARAIDEVEQLALLLSHRVSDAHGTLVPASPGEFRSAWERLKAQFPDELTASDAEVLGWHGREAEACMANGLWRAAVVHYDRFIQGIPRRFDPYKRRGNALASLGEWARAAADFEQAFRLGSDSTKDLRLSGQAYLAARDQAGYQRVCELAMSRYSKTESRAAANTVAWLGSIGPNGLKDPSLAVAMAKRIVEGDPENRIYVNTLGAALLRAGAYAEAVTQFLRCIHLKHGHVHPVDLSILAVARARLGDLNQAVKDLESAREKAAQVLAEKPSPDEEFSELAWVRRTEIELFLAEAEAVVAAAKLK